MVLQKQLSLVTPYLMTGPAHEGGGDKGVDGRAAVFPSTSPQAAKGLQLGPADPNNVSQRVPGLQGLHARGAPGTRVKGSGLLNYILNWGGHLKRLLHGEGLSQG